MIQFLALGIGLGAGLMLLFDPSQGKRRRALVRDKFVRAGDAIADIGPTANRVAHRLRDAGRGIRHDMRERFQTELVSDEVLLERVRAALGRVTAHPHAVVVTVQNGHVTLTGPILSSEIDRVEDTVRGVKGVVEVTNRLEPHALADGISALQGEPRRSKRGL